MAPGALIPLEIYSASFHNPFHAWLAARLAREISLPSPGRLLSMHTLKTKILWSLQLLADNRDRAAAPKTLTKRPSNLNEEPT